MSEREAERRAWRCPLCGGPDAGFSHAQCVDWLFRQGTPPSAADATNGSPETPVEGVSPESPNP